MRRNREGIKINDFLGEVSKRRREYLRCFNKVLSSGWYILGKEVEGFEKEFARFLGVRHCVGVGNGLEALQISLMALGVGEGSEVVTTPLSAVATTLSILAVGAKPVYADVDASGQINPKLIEKLITKKTRVVLPVHLYGQAADIKGIKRICKKNGLFLVEDAAQAHGSSINGVMLGTFGDLGCFSFYPTKNLGAFGDGGAIVTNNSKLASVCREIRDYGQKTKYVHVRYGLNSRLDEIQAAFLREKLKLLNIDNKKRDLLAREYLKLLKDVADVRIILPKIGSFSNFHLFVIRTKKRDQLKSFLEKKGIQTAIHYPRIIPDQPFMRQIYEISDVLTARRVSREVLSLPCHPMLEIDDINYVCKNIISFFKK